MDQLLGKIAAQSVSFAIKSGIGVVSSYAIREGSRYLRSIKGRDREELERLQDRLETKIRIISPAIDLVEIISARGNTSLETAVSLTKSLRYDIQALGQRLAEANAQPSAVRKRRSKEDIKAIMDDIKAMLNRIEDAVPLINLAVTTSGVNLSASVPHTVSPSRLLQASTLLTAGDTAYAMSPFHPAQIGMSFNLTLYMLFAGHSHRKEDITVNDLTWQEVISKARVKLIRAPLVFDEEDDYGDSTGPGNDISASQAMRAQTKADEYCYELCVIEDLDDGRVHEVEEGRAPPGPFEDVEQAGIRFRVPIHQISKIFYTNSGKLLGIDEANTPVLLIKRNLDATPPRKLLDRASRYSYDYECSEDEEEYGLGGPERANDEGPPEEEEWDLPKHLDPEWFAFEVWTEPPDDQSVDDADDSDTEGESNEGSRMHRSEGNKDPLGSALSQLTITSPRRSNPGESHVSTLPPTSATVKSNLSLLECLLRLASLQNYQQASHLTVHDELLNLFLSDANSWLGSHETREKERENAKRRIGFDPFGSPTSGDENSGNAPGTPNNGKIDLHKGTAQPLTPLREAPPRDRHILPMAPIISSTRGWSESPGAQLLLENASKTTEVVTTHSYPSTPAHSSRIGQTHDVSHHSASRIQTARRHDYVTTETTKIPSSSVNRHREW